MTDDPTVDMIEETLDLVAEWLMAADLPPGSSLAVM